MSAADRLRQLAEYADQTGIAGAGVCLSSESADKLADFLDAVAAWRAGRGTFRDAIINAARVDATADALEQAIERSQQ